MTSDALHDYPNQILSGKIRACKEQFKLVEYVDHVFASENIHVDYDRLNKYLSYERYMPFKLFPFEKYLVALFLCTFRADGRPRWNSLFIYAGRGFGKSAFAAFCAFCAMSQENGIEKYNVDVCANSEKQAKIVFSSFTDDILDRDPLFFELGYEWTKTYARNRSTNSVLAYHTNSPKSLDGMRPGMVIFDEIHAYQDFKSLNVFTTGLGKVQHPRKLYITTDGYVRDSPIDSFKTLSHEILFSGEDDGGFLPFVCRLDSDKEVNDPKNWQKANPSLPYRKDLFDEIKSEYKSYKRDPSINSDFMTKRMNRPQMRTGAEVTSWNNILACSKNPLPDLRGRQCVVGLDYANLNDMVGVVALFKDGDRYQAIQHAWICKNSRDFNGIKAPLSRWHDLEIVDGAEVGVDMIADYIKSIANAYDVRSIRIDQYRYSLVKHALDRKGFESGKNGIVKVIRPSDIMQVQPIISSALTRGVLDFGDSALMRWSINNACLEPAPHGNFTYGKIEPHHRKTDAFMAMVAAFTGVDEIEGESTTPEFAMPIIL